MPKDSIKLLLNEKIGLNAISVGDSSIQRAISHRLDILKIDDVGKYYSILLDDSRELKELIEEIVVPETWFFRNRVPFEVFVEIINKQILPQRNKKKKIRILSIPCSTGEEPYSLAIALFERGVNPKGVEITAIDVSRQALLKAERAIYTENSFRDTEARIIEKYFTKVESGYQLNSAIKELVKFKQGNILVGSLSPHPGYYDVVFCRNLLIYFDRDKQQLTLEKLSRSIKKNGILFVGHAEMSMVTDKYFESLKFPQSFSFQKKSLQTKLTLMSDSVASSSTIKESISEQGPDHWQKVIRQISDIAIKNPKDIVKNAEEQKNSRLNSSLIEELYGKQSVSFRPVEKLADQGKYDEALILCNDYLKKDPESAQGFYLLALIYNSKGESPKAESFLKKAIYLDPNHELALRLSSVLAENRGDQEAVNAFKRRLERVRQRNKNTGNM